MLSRLVMLFSAVMMLQVVGTTQASTEEQDENLAQIRIGHFVADMGNIDFYIDDVKAVIENMPFGNVSGWYQLPEGDYQLTIVPTGGNLSDAILEAQFTLEGGGWYSAFIGGLMTTDDLFLDVILEDYERLEFGQTRLSFYHGFPEAVTMVVDEAGNRLAFLDNHNPPIVRYASVVMLSGEREIQFLDGLNDNLLYDLGALSYGQQRHYLIALVGGASNPRTVIVSTHLLALEDDIQGDLRAFEDENLATTGFVRVTHLSSGTPSFDVYIDGELSEIEQIEFGTVSQFIELDAGTYPIQISVGDDLVEDTLIETEITLKGGQYLTVAVYGFASSDTFGVIAFEEDLSPIERGLFRLTVFQAVPTASSLAVLRDDGLSVISFLTYPGFMGGTSSAKAELVMGAYGFSVVDLANPLETLVEIPLISYGEGRNYLLAFIPIDVGYVIESIELPQHE